MALNQYPDDDEPVVDSKRSYREFDCPSCDANNPIDDGFKVGDEVLCNYCGLSFLVKDGGTKLKFKEL